MRPAPSRGECCSYRFATVLWSAPSRPRQLGQECSIASYRYATVLLRSWDGPRISLVPRSRPQGENGKEGSASAPRVDPPALLLVEIHARWAVSGCLLIRPEERLGELTIHTLPSEPPPDIASLFSTCGILEYTIRYSIYAQAQNTEEICNWCFWCVCDVTVLPFVGHVGAGSRHDGAYLRADDGT